MVQPINLIYRYLQNLQSGALVFIWLNENINTSMEGCIIDINESTNLGLGDACECHIMDGTKDPY